jgi:ADP-heptose:LPS heptosyltransferase
MTNQVPLKILVVRIGMTGDTLFALPLIKSIRLAHPTSDITAVVSPRGLDLLNAMGTDSGVDHLVTYNFYHPRIAKWSTRRHLEGNRFDAVFFLDTHLGYLDHFKSIVTSPQWYRMVSKRDDRGGVQIIQKAVGDTQHICRQYLQLAEAFGISQLTESYSFALPEKSIKTSEKLATRYQFSGRRVIGFHWGNHSKNTNILFPKETFDGRAWSMASFIELGKTLYATYPDLLLVLTGGPYERRMVKRLEKQLRLESVPVLNLAGKTNHLPELLGLLSCLKLFVVGDTGPMHLASAINTPTVGLFFATNPNDTGPYGTPNTAVVRSPIVCAPCLHTSHSYQCPSDTNCVKALQSELVSRVAIEKLGSPRD